MYQVQKTTNASHYIQSFTHSLGDGGKIAPDSAPRCSDRAEAASTGATGPSDHQQQARRVKCLNLKDTTTEWGNPSIAGRTPTTTVIGFPLCFICAPQPPARYPAAFSQAQGSHRKQHSAEGKGQGTTIHRRTTPSGSAEPLRLKNKTKNPGIANMERTSSIRRKTIARQHKTEVMIAGEQLRLRLHDGKLIKDRRYHLRTYPNCFVAQELIDWLVSHKEVSDRATAVCLMQHLMDNDIVHHVCDKRPEFKDAKLLYRFRKDDGTFPFNTEVKIFMRGQSLYENLVADKSSILQLREEHGVWYQRSFPGYQLIDWLLQNGEVESRRQGVELSRALQEHGIIQHVTKKRDFFDSGLLYQFCINFRRRRRLSELLNEREQENDGASIQEENNLDSPFFLRKDPIQEHNSAFQSIGPSKDIKQTACGRRSSLNSLQLHSGGFQTLSQLSANSVVRSNPKSVLKRHVTCEELLAPGAPFIRKVLTVIGDALGWGIVVRGRAPCYVQAVDPGSPAAAAGVKIRQFVCQVNGRCVLYLDYKTVTRLVMTGPRVVVLEVLEQLELKQRLNNNNNNNS
ncbi:LOW QUALITY PROTEIN: DEP domain-containing mTOR-interacting protein [Gambusia affinis]|uniref:LOW QUALITY PROTEIN: DEP domain-containing mTOR-interacting protein n=1 Tax=Gambusia affinis TaxID=33528 RepID=UPI001CDC967B|nr:LOW QUALITY PROTEIN: DEP domain-containing mTOR-interacting protein [Gambusia affinis]